MCNIVSLRPCVGVRLWSDKNHSHGPEAVFIHCFRKKANNLLRSGIGRYIPILWLATDQEIPYAATDNIRLKAHFVEGFRYTCNIYRYFTFVDKHMDYALYLECAPGGIRTPNNG